MAASDADGAMLVGECKWSVNRVGLDVLVDLKRKARVLAASGRWPNVSYALFAKAGFSAEVESVADSEGIRLVEPADILKEGLAD
jgi:hypothetical protein